MEKLTDLQRSFCREYVACGNASEAARRCQMGSAGDGGGNAGYLMFHKPHIKAHIKRLQTKLQQETDTDNRYVINELKAIVEACKETKQFTAANRALESLARIFGMFTDKHEITGSLTTTSENRQVVLVIEKANEDEQPCQMKQLNLIDVE